MRNRPVLNSSVYWLGCAILAVIVFMPELAHAQILDKVGESYQTASQKWESNLTGIAKGLFLKLALLELVWSGIWWVLERDDPNQVLVGMLKKIMGLMFFWAILLNFGDWIPAVINGFAEAGQKAAETGPLTPSSVLDRGLEVAAKVASASQKAGLFADGGLATTVLSGLSALGILLAFTVIAGQMLVTLIESYIVVFGGVLFLGFAGSRWTTTFSEKYISYSVSVGVKLFVTYLIIGAGETVTSQWAGMISAEPKLTDYMEILGGAMVYMFLAWQVPSLASSMLTGAVSMTLGSAAATVGTMAAGAAGAAGLAQAGLAGAGNGVAGAVQAGSAAIDQARAGGASGFLGVSGGAVGALASAGVGAAADAIKGLGGGSTGGNLAERMSGQTASLMEAAAAGAPAESVPGADPAAPADPGAAGSGPAAPGAPATAGTSGSTAAPSSGPAAAPGAGPAGGATPAAPQSSMIDTSGNVSQALADRDSGAASASPAPAPAVEAPAAAPESPAAPSADTASSAAPAAPAAPATAGNAPAGTPPAAPEKKEPAPNALQQFAEHASALGAMPNDSAAGAGVQINLKHD